MIVSNSVPLPAGPDILWGSIRIMIVATCANAIVWVVRRRPRV